MNAEVEQPVETISVVTSPLWNDYYTFAVSLSTWLTQENVKPDVTLVGVQGYGLDLLREFVTEFRWSKIAVIDDLSATQVGDLNVFFTYTDDIDLKNMIESLPSDTKQTLFVIPSD